MNLQKKEGENLKIGSQDKIPQTVCLGGLFDQEMALGVNHQTPVGMYQMEIVNFYLHKSEKSFHRSNLMLVGRFLSQKPNEHHQSWPNLMLPEGNGPDLTGDVFPRPAPKQILDNNVHV